LSNLHPRNLAATQTKGVSTSIYKKYNTKVEADEAYSITLRDGFVEILY